MRNEIRNAEQIKHDLAKKYRQPKGVEQFGIEAVPEELKTVKWGDLFAIIINFLVNPGMILIGGLAVAVGGLSFWGAVVAEMLGVLFAFGFYVAMATVGVDYGIPGQVATRMAYGITGSKWVASILRTLASMYWFAFQTLAGAAGITAVLKVLIGVDVNFILVSVVFAIFQALIAIIGYDSLKVLSRIAFPLKLVLMGFIIYLLMSHDDPNFAFSSVSAYAGKVGTQWVVLAVWINSVMTSWLCMITDAADFCRYSKDRKNMWIGTMSAALIGTFISAFIGAYGAAATLGTMQNTFEVVPQVTTNTAALIFVLIVIVLDNWCINVLNVYTGGLALSNIFTSIGRFWTTIITAIVGTVLSAIPAVVDQFVGLMSIMGNFFAPIAGILLADYLFLKKTEVDVIALFDKKGDYRYTNGFNLVAVGMTIVGFVVYFNVPEAMIQNLVTVIVTGILYYIVMKLVAGKSEAYAKASRPGRQYDTVSEDMIKDTVK